MKYVKHKLHGLFLYHIENDLTIILSCFTIFLLSKDILQNEKKLIKLG